MTATEIKTQLRRLRAERALAALKPLETPAGYVADLDEEIAAVNDTYVAAAVIEIATLRAELSGPQVG